MDPKHLKKIPLLVFAVVWATVFFGATTRNAAWVQWMHRVPGGLFSIVIVVMASALGFGLWHRHRSREGFRSLVGSDTWRGAASPVGLHNRFLESTRTCPAGDRRRGCEYVAEREIDLVVDGQAVTVTLGAFQWWWETRSRDKDGRTTYTRHRRVVGAVRLPVTGAFPPVAIGEEGMFAKLGIGGRGDMQLESEEFNRRFRVEVAEQDQPIVVRLLDAAFQQTMLERFVGREVELTHDVLLVGGDPDGHDGVHYGPAGEYERLTDDVATVVAAIPDGFWRAMSPAVDDTREPAWPDRT